MVTMTDSLPDIYIDADACPVKQEVFRVAGRHSVRVWVVANSWMKTPTEGDVELVVVGGGFDEADDWIVEHAKPNDIVISADIPLADRCLKAGAHVLGPRGRPFSEDSIGDAMASRELMSQLRDMGEVSGGPPPFDKKDRSRFLQELENLVRAALRRSP